ncbi:GNAT family N-acetyltransferase [Vallitalea okinawensis]|uniref:GNAT family N-acetyltransferase n=1 Tax=Vallitalea okinawensis TaxID=2078660 RepID=UPI000CFAE9BD|nr:GNAT family N-acetyltransferase [Vallitalea okinawensis]
MDTKAISIRPYEKSDAIKVSHIIRDNLIKVNSKDYPETVINYMTKLYTPEYVTLLSEDRDMYVAYEENVVVGTVSLEGDTLYALFVDVKYHGRGVGRKLLEFIENIASSNGIKTVQLPASLTAYQFYQKYGYIPVQEIESEEFGKACIMKKDL